MRLASPRREFMELRRSAKFVTPIPKPKKRKAAAQTKFIFDEGKGLSSEEQQYDPTSIINEVRGTRARDHLLVTGVAPVSEFLDDFARQSRRGAAGSRAGV